MLGIAAMMINKENMTRLTRLVVSWSVVVNQVLNDSGRTRSYRHVLNQFQDITIVDLIPILGAILTNFDFLQGASFVCSHSLAGDLGNAYTSKCKRVSPRSDRKETQA